MNEKKTFADSVAHCKSLGGSLAVPETEVDVQEIKNEIGECLRYLVSIKEIAFYRTRRALSKVFLSANDPRLNRTMFIGLTDSQTQLSWKTADTDFRCEKLGYMDWGGGEPNNAGGSEDCALMYSTPPFRGKWIDGSCNKAEYFLCQI